MTMTTSPTVPVRSVDEQMAILRRGCVEVIQEDELRARLAEGRPLRVKAGFDPTAADLHLGHTVLLQKLRQFQLLGHRVIFLIGDFTARIGDPTGRSETRPALSREAIDINAATYVEQVAKVLAMESVEVRRNSEWLDALGSDGMLRLAAQYTVARMLERDDFEKRYRDHQPIAVHEFLYPLIQGYDSVALDADVELGGTDQKFNLLVGRDLQRSHGHRAQVVMTLPLLEGRDGQQKMSKSLGNAIGVCDEPADMFGAIMSISDDLMMRYYELLSDCTLDHLAAIRSGSVHPMAAKKSLASEIVARFHGSEAGAAAMEAFERRFQRKEVPSEVPEIELPGDSSSMTVVEILVAAHLAGSKSEARRLIEQGGVRIDGARVTDPTSGVPAGNVMLAEVGKRRIAKIRFESKKK
ncbi:MAG TPA: tyrosine--tRNA ligase [Candidatus Limnocylindrales bacterium]|nr:tyrosine--tRNA ligase [Candidatus Limnocylindrales bacterium]